MLTSRLRNRFETVEPETTVSTFNPYKTSQKLEDSKSAVQKNLQNLKSVSNVNWFKGEQPTTRDVLGRIGYISQTDSAFAADAYQSFKRFESDPTSQFYNPYTRATNRAVSNLAALGIDTSNVDDEWFEKNSWLKNYYTFGGTTNNPTKPGKKASAEELAAYEYYQLYNSKDATDKAATQWQALQDEVSYWARRTDRNYSDEEILSKINWNNYSALTAMDEGREKGTPVELNRAIGYSRDNLYGVIWAARNGGSSGSMESDVANSVINNNWKKNQEIADRLDPNSPSYNPYALGSTLEEEGLYFNRQNFDQKWLNDNKHMLASNDATEQRMYLNVKEAFDRTQTLKEEQKLMDADIDYLLQHLDRPEDIIDAIQSSSDYKNLFALDKSLGGKLLGTTEAINYKWSDVEQKIRDRCAEKASRGTADSLVDDLTSEPEQPSPKGAKAPEGVATVASTAPVKKPGFLPDATQKLETFVLKKLQSMLPMIESKGTDAEKAAAVTGKTSFFDQIVDAVQTRAENVYDQFVGRITSKTVNNYLDATSMVHQYEGMIKNRDAVASELDRINAEWQPLHDKDEATRSIEGLDNDQLMALDTLRKVSAGEDYAWDEIKTALQNDPEDFSGLASLYWKVTGDTIPLSGTEEEIMPKLEQAQSWWQIINRQSKPSPIDELIRNANENGDDVDFIDEDFTTPDGRTLTVTIGKNENDQFVMYDATDGENRYSQDEANEQLGYRQYDFLTQEESERLTMLEARKNELEEQLNMAEADLEGNSADYKRAKADQVHLATMYGIAANMDAARGGTPDRGLLPKLEYAYEIGSEFVPTQWTVNNAFDLAVAEGTLPREQAGQQAGTYAKNMNVEAEQLESTLAYLDKIGVLLGDESRENIQRRIEECERQAKSAAYVMLDDAPNFQQVADTTRETAATGSLGRMAKAMATGNYGFEIGDLLHLGIANASISIQDRAYIQECLDAMTAEEKNRYFYLLGAEGDKAATDYLGQLTDKTYGVVNVRRSQEMQNDIRAYASQNGWTAALSTIGSMATNVLAGPSALIYEAGQAITGQDFGAYDPAFDMMDVTGALRQGSKDLLHQAFGDPNETAGGKIADLLYEAVTSAGDSWINAQFVGAFADAMGGILETTNAAAITRFAKQGQFGKFTQFAVKVGSDAAHAVDMGAHAAASAYREAILDGAKPDQALAIAGGTLIAETVSEAVTVGNMHSAFAQGADDEAVHSLVGYVKELVSGGLEEALGEGFNTWAEDKWERFIRDADSKYEKTVAAYEEKGYPSTLARQMADREMWSDVLNSAVVGFISSTFSSTAEYARGWQTEKATEAARTVTEQPVNAEPAAQESTEESVNTEATAQESTEAPVNEEISPALRKQDEAAVARIEAEEQAREDAADQFAQNLNRLEAASEKDETSVSAAITSVLNTGNRHADRGASQKMVVEMAQGDGRLASRVMQGLLSAGNNAGGTQDVTESVTIAALTDGESHGALQGIFDRVRDGGTVTAEDVNNLVSAVNAERANPAFSESFSAVVKEARVANTMMDILKSTISEQDRSAVKQAKENVARVEHELEDAQGAVTAAAENLQAVEAEYDPSIPETAAPLQQAMNHLDGADAQVAQKEAELESVQQNLEEAENDADQQDDQTMADARQQAVAQVEQEMQAEAEAQEQAVQQAFQEAQAQYVPTKAFSQPVTVKLKNGETVNLTGVYASVPYGFNAYTSDKGYVYETDIEDYGPGFYAQFDPIMDAWKDQDNPAAMPAKWLPHSLKGETESGEVVDIIGFAGTTDRGLSPILMDSNGNLYTNLTLKADPFTGLNGNMAYLDFFNNGEGLPDFTAEELAQMQNPGVQYPEGMTAYPAGTYATKTTNGQDIEVVGMIPHQSFDDSDFILKDGTSIKGADISAVWMSSDFFDWGMDTVLDSGTADIPDAGADDLTTIDVNDTASVPADQHHEQTVSLFGREITFSQYNDLCAKLYHSIHGLKNSLSGHTSSAVPRLHFYKDAAVEMTDVNTGEVYNVIGTAQDSELGNLYLLENGEIITEDHFQSGSTETDNTTVEQVSLNPETGEPLKDWQDPKYHGKVKKAKEKAKPKSKAFQKWFDAEHIPDEAKPYLMNDDGSPKIFYRGYGSFGNTLYTVHESKGHTAPNGKKVYINFYMNKKSTAASYAGTDQIANLRSIENWETAKAAMQDIGYDLVERQNSSGEWGYQVVNSHGYNANGHDGQSTWFAENELKRFRLTYGGGLSSKGIHAGFITMKKPLIISGIHTNYSTVDADITAPDGATMSGTYKTRDWAKWAFDHGYDAVIFDEVQDNVSGGGEYGVEIVTSQSNQFKSVFNNGKYGKTNKDILALRSMKKPSSPQWQSVQEKLLTGKPVEEYTFEERQELAEEMASLPEVQKVAETAVQKADTLPWEQSDAIKKFDGSEKAYEALRKAGVPDSTIQLLDGGANQTAVIESLFTPDAVEEQHRIRDMMAYEIGSVNYNDLDEKGKPKRTGEVTQGRRLDILAGLPAAGKSTLANALSAQYGSRILDSDNAKAYHKDYAGGANSSPLHNESRFITDQAMAIMIANGDNVVLPVVGHSYGSVLRQIQAFKAEGYDVHLHRVDLPWGKAIQRTLNRLVEDNRLLDLGYITGTDGVKLSPQKINDTFERLIKEGYVDGYATWNNDVQRGLPPVATGYSNIGEVSLTAGAFQANGPVESRQSGRGTDSVDGGNSTPDRGTQNIQALKIPRVSTPTQKQAEKARNVRSPMKIAKKLTRDLGIGDYIGTRKFGRLSSDIRAYYEKRAKYVGVRTKDAGNYQTLFHELGHAIADRFGLEATDDMVSTLVSIEPGFADAYAADELKGEAMAEFMWRYMEGEDRGRNFAGDAFYDAFEQTLRGTKEGKAIAEAREQLQMYLNATTGEQLGAHIQSRDTRADIPLRQRMREAIDALVDNTRAAVEFDRAVKEMNGGKVSVMDSVRNMALWANTAGKQATSILMGAGLTDANGNVIGPSLAARFKSVGFTAKGENLDLLERYMLALHSLDRDAQGKPVFDDNITEEKRRAFIAEIEQNHPEVAAAEAQFQAFRHDFMQEFMVNNGFLSQEALDMMEQMYPHYVPTYRVKGTDGIAQRTGKAKTYRVQHAKGSTEDIYSPLDSWFGMVNTMVTQNAYNRAALAFDRMYQQNEALGAFAHEVVNEMGSNNSIDLTGKQRQVADLVSGMLDAQTMSQLLEIVGRGGFNQESTASHDTLKVVRPNGTVVEYQFEDMELFKLLAGINNKQSNSAMDALGFVTRGMSALTTGSNPIFAARNFMRDFQNSVNYGSWASNYGTGVFKWLKSAYEVWKGSDDYDAYVALGGGGWTRIDPSRKASRNELYSGIFEGYDTANTGRTVKWAGKKVWNAITMARLNEVVEQASRFAEYKYGKHDLTTEDGRVEGYLAAQEATVDFNRAGNSGLATMLKKLVPFFNASTQGVYRTGRMLTQEEAGRAPARFTKTVVNTALMSALSAGIMMKFMDDDDKEEFEMLSDDLKSKHFYLPNFAPDILGEAPLIRIPLAQDPLTYAVHGLVTNAMWSGQTEDGLMIDLANIADTILDNLNPIGSGTVLAPILAINANKSWYGSRIVPSYLERNNYAPDQYTEETPDVFINMGRVFNISPLKVQYLAEQYTGFLGQLAIPALSPDSNGNLGGIPAALSAARKRFTSDPLISNDVVSSFYDGADVLNSVIEETNQGKPLNILRRGLTEDEAGQAYKDAKSLTSGIINETKQQINALYNEIDTINDNPTLSDHDKYVATSDKRRQMIDLALTANEAIGAFTEKYVKGSGLVSHILASGTASHKPTAEEELPQVFKDDSEKTYMSQAMEVYRVNGKSAALPHPDKKFDLTDRLGEKKEYEISDDDWGRYTEIYRDAYQRYLTTKGTRWETLSETKKYDLLKAAHSAANKEMKEMYARENGIRLK